MPRLRRPPSPSARSPLASTRALLHSIIPAPVRSRSALTSDAVISAIIISWLKFLVPFAGRVIARTGHPMGCPTAMPYGENLFAAFSSDRLGIRFGCLGSGSLTLRRRSRLLGHAQALRHNLLGILGVHILCVLHHAFFRDAFVASNLTAGVAPPRRTAGAVSHPGSA